MRRGGLAARIALLVVFCLVGGAARAQEPRILPDVQLGTAAGLGYNLPYTEIGLQLEEQIGPHFEAQGRVSFSPTSKAVTPDKADTTFEAQGRAVAWIGERAGLTMNVGHVWLRTSQFSKASWVYAPGVVLRGSLLGMGTRAYFDYLIPSGGLDRASGIESNRTQGPEVEIEARMFAGVRFVQSIGVYHILNQGDPLCDGSTGGADTCPRSGAWTGSYTVGVRFEWPRADSAKGW